MLDERIKQAMAIAHRAEGFLAYLYGKGLIGRGDEVRSAVESLLAFETTQYPDFVVSARIEVADALARLLDSHGYDSGERRRSTTQGES
jgi:hypothetical protein